MGRTIYISGGTRSGKSVFAEQRAEEFDPPYGYLATARALDDEMKERVSLHRERRGSQWLTVEEPLLLKQALVTHDGTKGILLVDCVTLWITNLLFHYGEESSNVERLILSDVRSLAEHLGSMQTPVILVSNEVGMGIVPENRLARIFRDIAGQANQILAATADEAWLVVSGLPLKMK
jgi:adenosylcobinamide kinase/adenosylcobinamide-phosphate guanylyltransferase